MCSTMLIKNDERKPLNLMSSNLKHKLTLRYMGALVLIAFVLCASYTILIQQISANEQDAYIINISGMQRMLSQRIALMAHEIHHANNKAQAEEYVINMERALARMISNHEELTTGQYKDGHVTPLSPEVYDHYFKEDGLNAQVMAYAQAAQDFLKVYQAGGPQEIRDTHYVNTIVTMAGSGLLENLNAMVYLYEKEAEEKIQKFKFLESCFVLLGLWLLLVEVLFIFRPMVKEVTARTQELERANHQLMEFSYRISHDLRAPIISCIGVLGISQKFLDDNDIEQLKVAHTHMGNSLKRLQGLIDDILNLTKMKLTDIEEEEVDVVEMIEKILMRLNTFPGYEKIKIEKDINLSGPITVKRFLLEQNIENLISNAIKYYDRSSSNPYVKISAEMLGGRYVFEVTDNGIGVPEQSRSRLFQMFQRFHPKTSFGSGLGLYLVAQNAGALSGKIEYEPLEKGSLFRLTFPVSNNKAA